MKECSKDLMGEHSWRIAGIYNGKILFYCNKCKRCVDEPIILLNED